MWQGNVDSELVLGIISPVGTDTNDAIDHIKEHLSKFNYTVEVITVSQDVLSRFISSMAFQE